MDGFTGFKTAATEELPDAVEIMDPFHVIGLAADALDRCRQRIQRDTLGHRGRSGDPLYGARRTLRTGAELLTEPQQRRLETVFLLRLSSMTNPWIFYPASLAGSVLNQDKENHHVQSVSDHRLSGFVKVSEEVSTVGEV